jgi:DsbC/DsbD-like thiol-disulfide interchange protein
MPSLAVFLRSAHTEGAQGSGQNSGECMGKNRDGCRSLHGLIAGVVLTAASALAAATVAGAQVRQDGGGRHVTATLVSETRSIVPGRQLHLALRQQMAPGWHTYWSNPGESGLPTTINWSVPRGFRAGPILWPTPERFTAGPVVATATRTKFFSRS